MPRFVVVGAGPAGLTVALQLAQAGQSVTLIEASTRFSRQFRGDALMPCGLEALAHLGLAELHRQLPHRTLQGWSVWLEGRRLFQVREPMGTLQPCTLVAQEHLLEHLLALARDQSTLEWLPGQAVQGLLYSDQRICGVTLADGRQQPADLVIGCDGRQSLLRRQAGLTLHTQGRGLELLWFELPGPLPADLDGGFTTWLAQGKIGSACISASGHLQLAWLLEPGAAMPQLTSRQWAEQLAAHLPPTFAAVVRERAEQLSAPRRVSVQVGLSSSWQRPGLLLLGDAAHPMSPVRAQGINMALRDSVVAAHWLSQAHNARELDRAATRVEQLRLPEIKRMQTLQSAEASQGHRLSQLAAARWILAGLSPLMGPMAGAIWGARQGPLRQGLAGALPAANLAPQRTNSIS